MLWGVFARTGLWDLLPLISSLAAVCTLLQGNTGNENIGAGNTGNMNVGQGNTGNVNMGQGNTGDHNNGAGNTGAYNNGDGNTGAFNNGFGNTGECSLGKLCCSAVIPLIAQSAWSPSLAQLLARYPAGLPSCAPAHGKACSPSVLASCRC
jgi:hypothetical protein